MKPEYQEVNNIMLTGTLLNKVCVQTLPNHDVRFITSTNVSEMPNNWNLVSDIIRGYIINYNIPRNINNNKTLREFFEMQISELMIETLSDLREEKPEEFI